MAHEHDWLTPSTLWSGGGCRQIEFYQPALFEFKSDEFMQEFLEAAAAPNPAALQKARLVQPPNQLNKLYQPAHGCFYLAAASLCCRQPGFPDRKLRPQEGETAGFVLRKLVDGMEYAWVAAGESLGWHALNGTRRTVLEHEERLPVFAVPLAGGRSTYCGYVPVGSSQSYTVAPTPTGGESEVNLPVEELRARFVAPLTGALVDNLPDTQAWQTSVYLVVELYEFLDEYLDDVAEAVREGTAPGSRLRDTGGDQGDAKNELLAFLQAQPFKGDLSLAEALYAVAIKYDELNVPGGGDLAALGFSESDYSLKNSNDLSNGDLEDLLDHVEAALPQASSVVEVPKLDVSPRVQYVLRFVFERPSSEPPYCQPPIAVVSVPSRPFTFAPFFDPDAPGRPVYIPLPTDVSIAGLRKYKKNVKVIMSDAMRKKVASIVGKESDLLTGEADLTEGGGSFAMICSFSFQIIFIVAFMLLMIFVVLLNLVFWWLPFFKICLPVPASMVPE